MDDEQAWELLQDQQRRAKAEKLGREIEANMDMQSHDWFTRDKEASLLALQEALDDDPEYCGRYRVVDATCERGRGTLIARDLDSDIEEFIGFDFDVDDEDEEGERNLKPQHVSSMKPRLRLRGRPFRMTPQGTQWVSSLRSQRAISAAAEWTVRNQHRDEEIRMATAAGNWERIAQLKRGRK